jgi:chromosome segregation ATPase
LTGSSEKEGANEMKRSITERYDDLHDLVEKLESARDLAKECGDDGAETLAIIEDALDTAKDSLSTMEGVLEVLERRERLSEEMAFQREAM